MALLQPASRARRPTTGRGKRKEKKSKPRNVNQALTKKPLKFTCSFAIFHFYATKHKSTACANFGLSKRNEYFQVSNNMNIRFHYSLLTKKDEFSSKIGTRSWKCGTVAVGGKISSSPFSSSLLCFSVLHRGVADPFKEYHSSQHAVKSDYFRACVVRSR